MDKNKKQAAGERRVGIRKRIIGTPERPRLSVYRSLNHIYAQVDRRHGGPHARQRLDARQGRQGVVNDRATPRRRRRSGKTLAERAKQAGVETVVFDRGGFRYHGRIKALADAARGRAEREAGSSNERKKTPKAKTMAEVLDESEASNRTPSTSSAPRRRSRAAGDSASARSWWWATATARLGYGYAKSPEVPAAIEKAQKARAQGT